MRQRSKRVCSLPKKAVSLITLFALACGVLFSFQFTPDADAQCVAWTDNPLTATTPIKATHVQQMRNCINTKRSAAGLSAFVFTDPVLTGGTSVIRAKHFLEIEQAVQGLYERDANWSTWFQTTYAAPLLDINSFTASPGGYVNVANLGPVNKAVKASTINTLRDAIDQGAYCGDGTCQIYNGLLATNPLAMPESCGVGKCDGDCDTPCSSVNSACSGGSLACGSSTCVPGQRCQTTTCYCTTTFACINDGACPTTCPNQNYTTASCGTITLTSAPVGGSRTIPCSGSCSGSVTGNCTNTGTFTGITDGCSSSGVGTCSQTYTQTCAAGGGCSAPGAWNQWRDWVITQYQTLGYPDPATTFSAQFTTLGNFYNANNNCTNFGDATNTTNIVMGPRTVRLTVAWFGMETTAPGSCFMSVGGSIYNGTCPKYPGCTDGIMNGTETAIDCGGFCEACSGSPTCIGVGEIDDDPISCPGPVCGTNVVRPASSCCSGVSRYTCNACGAQAIIDINGICVAPSCTDNVQNGTETGVDCGGSCSACNPTCTDGIQNQSETGVDCGGPNCAACTGNCLAAIVATAQCGNVQLPTTTNGNVGTAQCPVGTCGTANATCSSGSFGAVSDNCKQAYITSYKVAPALGGGNTTNNQSFVRCFPSAFTVLTSSGLGCSSPGIPGTDCTLTATNSCPATPSCSDGIRNYGETGIDCGGPCGGTCPGCPVTPVPTGTGCGVGSLPARAHGLIGTAGCPSGCSGSITGLCYSGSYTSISNNCQGACGGTNCYRCVGPVGFGATCQADITGPSTASDCGGAFFCY